MMLEESKPVNPLVEVKKVKSAYETFTYMLKEKLQNIINNCDSPDEFEEELGEVVDLIEEYNAGDVTFKDIVSGLKVDEDNSIMGLVSTLQQAIDKIETLYTEDDPMEDLFDFRDYKQYHPSLYMGDDDTLSLIKLAEDSHMFDY